MDIPAHIPTQPDDPVQRTAQAVFGVSYLYPYQRLVIANILDAVAPVPSKFSSPGTVEEELRPVGQGQENPDRLRQFVLLPTGYGKSLCFQLPSVFIRGVTLAVFPLRSLMADQERRLHRIGLPCAVLRGGMERHERERIFSDIRTGKARLVIANPEILRQGPVLSLLRSVGVIHAVVDEAHCVAEWGDDFRPAYTDLGDILRHLDPVAVTAFTATASPDILARAARVLFSEEPYRVISGDPDRPNIRYGCVPTLSKSHTLERLARALPRPLLVFCASRPGTELTAEFFLRRLATKSVRFYHAGLSKAERSAVENWFLSSGDGILTATCAFGMGIDKPDIRTVLHADPPPSVEAYLQESGRAGRDGKLSWAILLSHPTDANRLNRIADPIQRERRAALLAYGRGSSECRRESLARLLGSKFGSCAGCDVCEGWAAGQAEGRADLLRFACANDGRFYASQAPRLLAGLAGPCAHGGALKDWMPDHIGEALALLRATDDIQIPTRGPWKGRLRIKRS